MDDAGGATGVCRSREGFTAVAVRVVADNQVAGQDVHLLPVVVDERRRRIDAGIEPQKSGAAPGLALLIEIAREDFLLDARGISGRRRPAAVHVEPLEFQVRFVHGHSSVSVCVHSARCARICLARCIAAPSRGFTQVMQLVMYAPRSDSGSVSSAITSATSKCSVALCGASGIDRLSSRTCPLM